jgi:hypothetical protein
MSSNALTVHGGGSIMPALTVQQASERYNILVEYTKTVMVRDQDYGTIPGVAKPCLYKAGAEKLSSLFGLAPAFELIEKREDWTGRESNGEPLFYYFYKCKLYRGGELVGEADGSCNSWEKKYRYRDGKRKCPKCGGEFIITGKAEYGGGFLCFAKKGGCGAKFRDGDESITKQSVAAVPNPDIPEVINTVQKMAQKRALVAAVLIACNASAFYTQDVEDMRTIDVDYEPFEGSKENQREYLASKGINPDVRTASEQHKALIVEGAKMLDEPPQSVIGQHNAGLGPIEIRHAKKQGEAQAILDEAQRDQQAKMGRSGAHGCIPLDKLKNWKKLKDEIRSYTGTDEVYKATLKAKGYEHANEIQTQKEATSIWTVLGHERNRLKQEKELLATLEHASEVIGVRQFSNILGAHGAETIADALKLEGDPLGLLLTDLKAHVDQRKGQA